MKKLNKQPTKLNISIYDKEVFADYGYDNHELMEESLIETIYNLANTKPIKEDLELVFAKKEDVSIDEERFKSAYLNSINNKSKSISYEMIRCFFVGVILLIVGIGFLAVSTYLLDANSFIYEFITILAWVFCWGGIEVLAIQLVQLAIEKKKYKRLLKCKISFKN